MEPNYPVKVKLGKWADINIGTQITFDSPEALYAMIAELIQAALPNGGAKSWSVTTKDGGQFQVYWALPEAD